MHKDGTQASRDRHESVSERFRLARKLVSLKQTVARTITDKFFLDHPDWGVRYGERGREFCSADVCFHVEFLAGAIEAGSPEAFGDYARWTAGMLAARGIAAHSLEENFAQLAGHLSALLLSGERSYVLNFLARGREACAEPEVALEAQPAGEPLDLTRQVFLAAILGGQRQAALNIVNEALNAGHSHTDICVDVFARSLHHVGKLWELNRISVAQEHMATSITQYAIAGIYPRLVPSPVRRGSMVVTGVSGELHQIGANLVADAMEANGWTVRFLGTNLPHSAILSTVEESVADVLCISTTIVANLPSVADLVGSIRAKLGERAPKIVLGGRAYGMASQFAGEIGAIGGITDLRQALAMLCADSAGL
jgi:MerR family transcriptional regulator, light-induced transcriptional regulator